MRQILLIVFCLVCQFPLWGQVKSGNDGTFNPENPADPEVPVLEHTVTLECSPGSAASVGFSSLRVKEGENFYVSLSVRSGYVFKEWQLDGEVVSTDPSFYYTMGNKDLALKAILTYDPTSPEDPSEPVLRHTLTVKALPQNAGSFNTSTVTLAEGEAASLYAYPRGGFRFKEWIVADTVYSTSQNISFVMGEKDEVVYAKFDYMPENPNNPGSNYWNGETGEVVVDDFQEGNLWHTLQEMVGSQASSVTMITVAGKMSQYDFGFASNFTNCTLLDLKRTYGYTNIPSYTFYNNTSLNKVILPSGIETIESSAFSGCSNLSELVSYAVVPPEVEYNAFYGVPEGTVLRVLASSVSLYAEAEGWKDFVIMPLSEQAYSLEASLPQDAADGHYKNMFLELLNVNSGQKQQFVISDRVRYTFNGLLEENTYRVSVKNAAGQILGQSADLLVGNQDLTVQFDALLQPQTVQVKVTDPAATDLTDRVQVRWFTEDGQYIQQGAVLTGQLQGTKLKCQFVLPEDLAMRYQQPEEMLFTVQEKDNVVSCRLENIEQILFSGRVLDATDDRPIQGAVLSLSQVLNGRYTKTIITSSDQSGHFSVQGSQAPTNVIVSAKDYVNSSIELQTQNGNVELGDIKLKKISGTVVTTNFTYTESVSEGETATVTSGYTENHNVEYEIYNVTQQSDVLNFSVQYPKIILMDAVNAGDQLRITARSKTNAFNSVTGTTVVGESGEASVDLPIVQLGGLKADFESTKNSAVIGILYNQDGQLMKTYTYSNNQLTVSDLADGNYIWITMARSSLFGSILNLDQFDRIGLQEGKDYLKQEVSVESGRYAVIHETEIPLLDESKLAYTDGKTYFSVNKASVIAGNYLTLKGEIKFKPDFKDAVSNVSLVVDLPQNCSFVDNSVMIGSQIASYMLDGQRLTIPLSNYEEAVKFCVIPTDGGSYLASAFVDFFIAGQEMLQPIGSASYQVDNMLITLPARTASKQVRVSGTSLSNADVLVYDDGVLIGQTKSIANGSWNLRTELPNLYQHSYHKIYAEVISAEGVKLTSETKILEYDANYIDVSKVNMICADYDIEFDFLNPTNKKVSYTYPMCGSDFSFLVNFTQNDTSKIKDVRVHVLMMDGKSRVLDALYNAAKQCWVAYGAFKETNSLPVSCWVDFNMLDAPFDNSEREEEQNANIAASMNELETYINDKMDVAVTDDEDNRMSFTMTDQEQSLTYQSDVEILDVATLDLNDGFVYHQIDDTLGVYLKPETSEQAYKMYVVEADKKTAYSMQISKVQALRAARIDWGKALDVVTDIAAGMVPFGDYLLGVKDYKYWVDRFPLEESKLRDLHSSVFSKLMAKCSDGSYKLTDEDMISFEATLKTLSDNVTLFYDAGNAMLDRWNWTLRSAFAYEALTMGFGKVLGMLPEAKIFLKNSKNAPYMRYVVKGGAKRREAVAERIDEAYEDALEDLETMGDWGLIDMSFKDFESASQEFAEWLPENKANLNRLYLTLERNIVAKYKKCDGEEEDEVDEDPETDYYYRPYIEPIIDPAGFVYEAVSSNRVQGATATCYYKEYVEDMYGNKVEQVGVWNAEEYAQENPLFTDENGMYRWDVPQGLWQVKFEKEGYQTTTSEWLPVPPPQLEVNIPMTQNSQPEVKQAHAYEDGIDLEFNKYMLPEDMVLENIFVQRNGENTDGKIVFLNQETAGEGQTESYVSKVRFEPNEPFLTTDQVVLTVSRKVRSYAGLSMQSDYVQEFDIEKEIKKIVADSLAVIGYTKKKELTVSVLPYDAGIGKKLCIKPASSMLLSLSADTLVLDEFGQAKFSVSGDLPGNTSIVYKMADSDIADTTLIQVTMEALPQTPAPVASRPSGTALYRYSEIELSCDHEGAVIYYTTDGTCPCDENGTRQVYEDPIVVTGDMTIKAMAVSPDLEDSPVVDFVYTIKKTNLGLNLETGWNWISHNLEEPLEVSELSKNATRILGQTEEVILDPVYGLTGNLKNLNPQKSYKVLTTENTEYKFSGYEFDGSQNFQVKKGWNWIGFPVNQTLSLDEAFQNAGVEPEDYIVGQDGFAQFGGESWVGTLKTLMPGSGYMYYSNSEKTLGYHTAVVSKAKALYAGGLNRNMTPWTVDKRKYPNVMCLIAHLYDQNGMVEPGSYSVGAFCGTECRGIGSWVDGKLMMSIYGNGGEQISFKIIGNNSEITYAVQENVPFAETLLGSLNDPYTLMISKEVTGIGDMKSACRVWPEVFTDKLYVTCPGESMDMVTLTDAYGRVVLVQREVQSDSSIDVAHLTEGVYIVTVKTGSDYYYKKLLKVKK